MFTHMAPKGVAEAEVAVDAEVMASVEEGPTETFVIADISRDDAYLTTPLADAASLPAWR
jgi:histidinol dehydrogenase